MALRPFLEMKRSTQASATSSPRFSRGLALLLVAGLLAPAAISGLRWLAVRGDARPVMAQVAVDDQSQARRFADYYPSEPACASSLREMAWKQIFAEIERQGDEAKREEMWATLAAEIPQADLLSALDELQRIGQGNNEIFQQLVRRWVQADGRAAAAWAEQLPPGAARQGALEAVAIEWAGADLNSAAAWARQLPDVSEQQTLLLAVANESVRRDPLEALRLAAELPPAPGRDEMVRRAVMEWALSDASAAVDWASLIPDTTLREQVMASAAIAGAESAPDAAAKLAVENLPAGRLLDDTVVAIVQRWAQQQPEAAAAWVESFPGGSLRVAAIENLVAQWSQIDEEGAKRWQAAHL